MKNQIFFIILSCLLCGYVMPVLSQQPFYIYSSRSGIHTFITSDIDSITYSRLDLDSVLHDEYVTQEVWTLDTVYRLSLTEIDSVGFVTPKTIYQPNVVILEGKLRQHIASHDSMEIVFDSSTPSDLIPYYGDKLVSTVGDSILDEGFLGAVAEKKYMNDGSVKILCTACALTDVFKQYFGMAEIKNANVTAKSHNQTSSILNFYNSGWNTLSPGRLSYDIFNNYGWAVEYNADNGLAGELDEIKAALAVTPNIGYRATLTVHSDYGVSVSFMAIADYTFEEEVALMGEIHKEKDKDIKLLKIPLKIPEILSNLYFEFGAYAKASMSISTQQKWAEKYRHVFHWEWTSENHRTVKDVNTFKHLSSSHTGELAIDGSLEMGFYGEAGLEFIGNCTDLDVASVHFRAEAGVAMNGTLVVYKKDAEYAKTHTDLYNQLKNEKIGVYINTSLEAEAQLFRWSVSHEIPVFPGWLNRQFPIGEFRCVPIFSHVTAERNFEDEIKASERVLGYVWPTSLGFAAINKNDVNDVRYMYIRDNYNGAQTTVSGSFNGLKDGAVYTVYPLVRRYGLDLIAEPYVEVKNSLDSAKMVLLFENNGVDKNLEVFQLDNYPNKQELLETPDISCYTLRRLDTGWGATGDIDHVSIVIDIPKYRPVNMTYDEYTAFWDKYSGGENSIKCYYGKSESEMKDISKSLSSGVFTISGTPPREGYYLGAYSLHDLEPGDYVCRVEAVIEGVRYSESGTFHIYGLTDSDINSKYVDLGLSVKWANSNYESKTPFEQGTFINFVKDISKSYSVPNIDNFFELITQCEMRYGRLKGVMGMLFTGKTGNSIFFPDNSGSYSYSNGAFASWWSYGGPTVWINDIYKNGAVPGDMRNYSIEMYANKIIFDVDDSYMKKPIRFIK